MFQIDLYVLRLRVTDDANAEDARETIDAIADDLEEVTGTRPALALRPLAKTVATALKKQAGQR